MQTNLEVLFTPADFNALKTRDLTNTDCVVFDVLRATTSMLAAFDNGATQIIPVKEISEAVALRQSVAPDALLAGERDGLRICAAQSGGVDFDLGNSPREFTRERVEGRSIIMTTTNGTRALQACRGARHILVGAFLNLAALAEWIAQHKAEKLLLVCAGTYEEAAYEDTLAAGALCSKLRSELRQWSDSAQIARAIFRTGQDLISPCQLFSSNARRLLANPDLRDDVPFALRYDKIPIVAEMKDGAVRKITSAA